MGSGALLPLASQLVPRRGRLNRQDLEREFESTILAAIAQSPCPSCGGDLFTIQHHVKATAYYLTEIVKALKLEEGKFRTELPFEEVKKRADKKTAKFFAELSTKELEKVLGTPGLPSGELPLSEVETVQASPEPEESPSQLPSEPEDSEKSLPLPLQVDSQPSP